MKSDYIVKICKKYQSGLHMQDLPGETPWPQICHHSKDPRPSNSNSNEVKPIMTSWELYHYSRALSGLQKDINTAPPSALSSIIILHSYTLFTLVIFSSFIALEISKTSNSTLIKSLYTHHSSSLQLLTPFCGALRSCIKVTLNSG